jgi:predicted HicB family RNase H-like nuclease
MRTPSRCTGEVAGLRDVIIFQADSAAGIEKAFRESVDDYLGFCRQRGEKSENPTPANSTPAPSIRLA